MHRNIYLFEIGRKIQHDCLDEGAQDLDGLPFYLS
jgi:hypothetical protein